MHYYVIVNDNNNTINGSRKSIRKVVRDGTRYKNELESENGEAWFVSQLWSWIEQKVNSLTQYKGEDELMTD